MENQHKMITGYRDLTQAEIDLMNRIKKMGEEVGALLKDIPYGNPSGGDADKILAGLRVNDEALATAPAPAQAQPKRRARKAAK